MLQKRVNKNIILKFFIFICILLGIAIVCISIYYHLNQTYVGFAILLACLFFILFKNNININSSIRIKSNEKRYSYLLISCAIFTLLFTSSILLLRLEIYHRSIYYFIIISIVCSIIASQILIFTNDKKNILIILIEIFAISIGIRFSIYFLFPGVHGVDSWYHVGLIKEIIESGHIPIEYGTYSKLPFLHIFLSIQQIITGTTIKNTYITIGVIEVISTIFIFLLCKRLFNVKIGLLSVLLLNISDYFISWGVDITSMSLGLVFFIIILYLIFKKVPGNKKEKIIWTLFLILFLISINLTHIIATFIMFILLLYLFVYKIFSQRLNKKLNKFDLGGIEKINVSFNLILFFSIYTLSFWIYVLTVEKNYSFFESIVHSILDSINTASIGNVGLVTNSQNINFFIIFLDHIGYFFLLILMLIGCFSLLRNKFYFNISIILIGAIGIIFFFIYPSALFGLNTLLPERWFVFLYILLSILAAAGLFSLIGQNKGSIKKIVFISIIILLFTFFMISDSLSNNESSFYPTVIKDSYSYSRANFYDSEMIVGHFIEVSKYNGTIIPDLKYITVFKGWYSYKNTSFIVLSNRSSYINGLVLLRNDIIKGYISDHSTDFMYVYQKTPIWFIKEFENPVWNIIYNNGEVKGYLNIYYAR